MEGQVKIDFVKWLENHDPHWLTSVDGSISFNINATEYFYQLTDAERFGVIQDFAYSVGYYIEVGTNDWYIITIFQSFNDANGEEDTRAENRTAAVEKFTELYNLKFEGNGKHN